MMNTQTLKLIFKGRLEFGNQRTFQLAHSHWEKSLEVYFKTDILFKSEDVFDANEFSLNIPQTVVVSWEKPWRNTCKMLYDVAQFAVVGRVFAWCLDKDKGILVEQKIIEPETDKVAVVEYQRGRALSEQAGMETEAAQALGNAIEKYERHALAYERRGFINYKLKNYKDAYYDFAKSIDINPNNPEPYYGRGKVKMLKNEWESALADFNMSIAKTIALQPLHWRSRFNKGECLFHLKRYKEAAAELKLFLDRKLKTDDPNVKYNQRSWQLYGKSLFELGEIALAIDAFNMALSIKESRENREMEAENLLQRGKCLHKVGNKEFSKDLKAAAALGNAEAARLLEIWHA